MLKIIQICLVLALVTAHCVRYDVVEDEDGNVIFVDEDGNILFDDEPTEDEDEDEDNTQVFDPMIFVDEDGNVNYVDEDGNILDGDDVIWKFRRRDECVEGGGGGDPHFRMWDHEHFSYHGQCDLLLVRSPTFASGRGLEVHIRTEIKNHYSFIQGLAVKLGKDNFEMQPKDKFYFNGGLYDQPLDKFAGYPLQKVEVATWCRDKCANAKIYRMLFDDGYIEMANWAGFLHVEFTGIFNDTTGLLGKSGKTGRLGRNGTLIADVNEYGSEWQVNANDPVLFQVPKYPQHPEKCILPKESFRRTARNPVTRRMAEDACSHIPHPLKDMCEFDVEATGNKEMAFSPIFH